MRACFLLLMTAWLFSFLHAAAFQQNPASGFTIAGVVEQHGSNQPLRRVEVSISPVERRDQTLSCMTANDGRFSFTNLPAGKYSLTAQMHGLNQGYRGDEEYSTAIVAGPRIDSEHIDFLLDVPLTISGTVLDEEGEPVRNAQVFLFHQGIFSGRPQIAMQGQTGTGSSGDFHFRSLKRGTYFVAVSARPWYAQDTPASGNGSEFDVAYPITYYGESLDAEGASPITLSDTSVTDIAINVRPVRALRLQVPSNQLNFQISAVGPGGVSFPLGTTETVENNRREITGVAPGRYVVTAHRFENAGVTAFGTKTVDLTGSSTLDLSDLRTISISGQLQTEGGAVLESKPVVLLRALQANQGAGYGPVTENGSFHISSRRISPGKYRVGLANTRDLYIKSIAATGAEFSHGILDVSEGASVQLSIVAAKGLSEVNGIALKDDKPFPGAMVLLLPQDPSRSYIPRDQSDSDGTFTLPSVPPGRYTLIAIDDGRDLAYALPSVIKPYVAQGQSIEIPLPKGVTGVKINVQPRLR